MCVTRHSRQHHQWGLMYLLTQVQSMVRSILFGILFSSAAPPLQPHLLFMKSHLHSHYNKCQQSKEPTCFSMSVITRDVSWCCVKNCPCSSLLCFSTTATSNTPSLCRSIPRQRSLAWTPTRISPRTRLRPSYCLTASCSHRYWLVLILISW